MEETAVPLWAIAVIGGPILLAAALAFGRWRNRRNRGRIDAERHAAYHSKDQ
jgi:hypothetical protein